MHAHVGGATEGWVREDRRELAHQVSSFRVPGLVMSTNSATGRRPAPRRGLTVHSPFRSPIGGYPSGKLRASASGDLGPELAGREEGATSTVRARFGALLKCYRLAAGLTQEALAERAGLSARAVSDLERDPARRPRLDSLALLADALALTAAQRGTLQAAAHQVDAALVMDRADQARALPLPLSSFVGRQRELEELAMLLKQSA